jgi:hypothetical protein
MQTPTHTLELPTGPIRGYFTPWVKRREEDPRMVKLYEELWERHRRQGNIKRLGLSVPAIDLFRNLFVTFAMFAATCGFILAGSYVWLQMPRAHANTLATGIFQTSTLALFTTNLILAIWSIAKSLYKAFKEA